eukprot:278412-Amphidinium_carterae.1
MPTWESRRLATSAHQAMRTQGASWQRTKIACCLQAFYNSQTTYNKRSRKQAGRQTKLASEGFAHSFLAGLSYVVFFCLDIQDLAFFCGCCYSPNQNAYIAVLIFVK